MDTAPATPIPRRGLPLIDEETKSLFQLGFIVPIDFVFLAVLVMTAFGSAIWFIAARPDFVYVVGILACCVFLTTIWLVTLAYRIMYFVLKLRAVMEILPEEAGKIAFKIHEIQIAQAGKKGPLPTL